MMGTIKVRNDMDLTEVEDIKKSWQEYTEELYKKDFHDPDNHNGVITHQESDILECKIQWSLGNITTNKVHGGNRVYRRQRVFLERTSKSSVPILRNSIVSLR